MSNINNINFVKKDISVNINKKLGISLTYTNKILDDLIVILKQEILFDNININNFGTFKKLKMNERIGRNPKNNIEYKIVSRIFLSFIASKKLTNKINKF